MGPRAGELRWSEPSWHWPTSRSPPAAAAGRPPGPRAELPGRRPRPRPDHPDPVPRHPPRPRRPLGARPGPRPVGRDQAGRRAGPGHTPPASGRGAGRGGRRPVVGGRADRAEAIIPVDRFVAYLEAERAFPEDSRRPPLARPQHLLLGLPGLPAAARLPPARRPDPARQPAAGPDRPPPPDGTGRRERPRRQPGALRPAPLGRAGRHRPPVPRAGGPAPPRTTVPFSAYGVPNIDATGWVADVGMASVWTTRHARRPDPRVSRPLPAADRDAYYLMSAPDADLLGDVDVFAMRAQWALAAGQPSRPPCAPTTWAARGGRPGMRWRWRAFASVNRLVYRRSGGRIAWDPDWWPGWVRRIDRFNDVYGAGVGGSCGAPSPARPAAPGRRRPTCSPCSWTGPSRCSRPSWREASRRPPGRAAASSWWWSSRRAPWSWWSTRWWSSRPWWCWWWSAGTARWWSWARRWSTGPWWSVAWSWSAGRWWSAGGWSVGGSVVVGRRVVVVGSGPGGSVVGAAVVGAAVVDGAGGPEGTAGPAATPPW